jgi:DNA topoisomerase-1
MNIIRVSKNDNFEYKSTKGDVIKNATTLERIKNIRIPPAWINVLIANNSKAEVQAIGEDAKGRMQYLYSKEWINNQEKTKFVRLIYFLKNINYIRKNVKKILKEDSWSKEKLIAFIITIIDQSGLRIGNEKYEELYETHGITTLKKQHIKMFNNKIELNFIGKKNVINTCTLKNNILIKLFKNLNEYNQPNNDDYFFTINCKILSNTSVNNFLKKYGNYTIKDFRTYRANIDFITCLYNTSFEITEYKIKRTINKCLDIIAERLNNSRSVLKNKYICNIIINKYLTEPTQFYKKIKYYEKHKSQNLNMYESGLLYYLKLF